VLARAITVRPDRSAWFLMAGGLGAYAAGTVLWVAVLADMDPPPYPSPADVMWLAYYPFAYAAVLHLLRARWNRISAATWLDGLIASACAAAYASVVFLPGLGGATGESVWSVVVSAAYPIADIVLAGLLLGAWALSGWRTERVWVLLLPVDDLKLDRAFVAGRDTDARCAAIVKSTVELAHNLGMRLIAEGAENEAVVDRLRQWDCDLVQGYHVSRPQPPDLLTAWLLDREAAPLPTM
jgi:EAL domain-containing protein